jgi:hypothetical protein
MHKNHERTSAVRVHRGVSERGERPTSHVCGGGRAVPSPDRVSGAHPLHDQVRNLRMALSDLKIQVRDLAAVFERE